MLEKQKSFHHVAREILESPYLLSSHFVFGRTSISISKRLHHSVVGLSQLLFVQLTYVCAFVRPSLFFFIFLLAVMLTSSLIGAWKCNSCRKLWQTDQTERLINQPTDKQSERPGHKNSRRNIDFFGLTIFTYVYIFFQLFCNMSRLFWHVSSWFIGVHGKKVLARRLSSTAHNYFSKHRYFFIVKIYFRQF